MAVNRPRITGGFFEEALILVNQVGDKDFCQAIFLISNIRFMEIQIFLDCCDDYDFFSVRAVHHAITDKNFLLESYGDKVRRIVISNFRGISTEIVSFHGEEYSLAEIGKLTILSDNGTEISMIPDPDRMVADQMYVTNAR